MGFQPKLCKIRSLKHLICRMSTTANSSLVVECLNNKSLLRVSGNDADVYLQGLMTNDIGHLSSGATSMYSMFLNNKGRVLYDSIIYKTSAPNTFFIECDSSIITALRNHLMPYRLRKKIDLTSLENEFNVWTVCTKEIISQNQASAQKTNYKDSFSTINLNQLNDVIVSHDPRISALGVRILAPKEMNIAEEMNKICDISVQKEIFYTNLRYKLGVGEGPSELPPGECIPLEVNCDYLHGVSFHKGCYIGQELTARVHHTGVVRKRIMPIISEDKIQVTEPNVPILLPDDGKQVGKVKGFNENVGIGLLRIAPALQASSLKINNVVSKTYKPFWWPEEAPKEKQNTQK